MEQVLNNFRILGKSKDWINTPSNKWSYGIKAKIEEEDKYSFLPFIDYVLEDKSEYPLAKDCINPKTGKNWVDPDCDFLIGKSGGLLMKMDFIFVNTDVFTKVAKYHDKHGKYCPYEEGTIKYEQFWRKETERRRKGVQAKCKVYYKDIEEYFNPKTTEKRKDELRHYIRITGDHYNYINYGRIERTPTDEERRELDRMGLIAVNTLPGFPRFWDADYWYFKADEFAIRNKKNETIGKSRRKGMSYKRGSQAANRVNLNKAVTVVFAADIIDYLTDPEATADMAKKNLSWYETQTYWKRGFLSEAADSIELGYKKSKEGNKKYGFQSKILSVAIGRNESAAIGKKAIDIDFEEAGKCPNLQAAWNVTLNNIESGAIKIGTGRIYGTAGTKGANWTAFKNVFYNTDSNNMIAFENVWNKGSRHLKCGFFIPQVWCCEPYIYDGNSLLLSAWEWDKNDKIQQKKESKPSDYIIYCAQRANSPAEAFIDTKDNLFSSPTLNDHINDLYDNAKHKYYKDGWYKRVGSKVEFWDRAYCEQNDIFQNGGIFHPYIDDVPFTATTDIHGCVREFFPPFRNQDGDIPEDLYFITVDTFRVDKDKEQVDVKNSLYSIQCWMGANRITPYPGKRLVASYCGRLDTMAECDTIALHMAIRYGCGVLPEAGTGEIITNFKTWGFAEKLMYDPSVFVDRNSILKDTTQIGVVVGDSEKKLEGLRMLRDFLYEVVGKTENNTPVYRLHHIPDLAFCLELQKYTLDGNYDRVSSAIVAMFEFRKRFVLMQESTEQSTRTSNIPLRERLKRKYVNK